MRIHTDKNLAENTTDREFEISLCAIMELVKILRQQQKDLIISFDDYTLNISSNGPTDLRSFGRVNVQILSAQKGVLPKLIDVFNLEFFVEEEGTISEFFFTNKIQTPAQIMELVCRKIPTPEYLAD